MGKIIRLTESQLTNVVKRLLNEQQLLPNVTNLTGNPELDLKPLDKSGTAEETKKRIINWQLNLNKFGNYNLKPDGIWGKKTNDAYLDWKSKQQNIVNKKINDHMIVTPEMLKQKQEQDKLKRQKDIEQQKINKDKWDKSQYNILNNIKKY